jgi:hypothetical protein
MYNYFIFIGEGKHFSHPKPTPWYSNHEAPIHVRSRVVHNDDANPRATDIIKHIFDFLLFLNTFIQTLFRRISGGFILRYFGFYGTRGRRENGCCDLTETCDVRHRCLAMYGNLWGNNACLILSFAADTSYRILIYNTWSRFLLTPLLP